MTRAGAYPAESKVSDFILKLRKIHNTKSVSRLHAREQMIGLYISQVDTGHMGLDFVKF